MMKKRYTLLLAVILLAGVSFGQDYDDDPPTEPTLSYNDPYGILNYKLLSPEAYSFQETSLLDVQNSIFYGRFNYAIPLYEIKTGGISIPISLSYSSGGLRVEQQATDAGLGWQLSNGGMVTRKVEGGLPDYAYYSGYFNGGNPGFDPLIPDGGNDQSPDEYMLSALGISDQFTEVCGEAAMANDGFMSLTGSNNHYKFEVAGDEFGLFNYKKNGIDIFKDIKRITVYTANGLMLTFVPVEGVHSFSWVSGTIDYTYYYTAWGLESVKDLNSGREVRYVYDQFKRYYKRLDINLYYGNVPGGGQQSVTSYRRRLLSIQWDGGKVLFNYGKTRSDLAYVNQETGVSTLDVLLSKIVVLNSEGVTVKQFDFGFDYFQTPSPANANDYRLKLVSLTEKAADGSQLPPYQFTYYEDTPFPSTESLSRDYWGYYNNSGASTLKPKLYFYPNFVDIWGTAKTVEAYYPYEFNSPHLELNNNGVDRSPSELACKTGMLRRVTTPTGGYRAFDYELNTFGILGTTQQGGGLRLKSQTIGDGATVRSLSYTYSGGFISRFPSFATFNPPSGGNISATDAEYMSSNTLFNDNSLFEPVLLNGSYVGYSQVTEAEAGNGKKVYHFNSNNGFDAVAFSLNELVDGQLISTRMDGYIRTSDAGHFLPRLNPRLGLLQGVDYYNSSDNLVKIVAMDYAENIRNVYPISNYQDVMYGVSNHFKIISNYALKDWYVGKSREWEIDYPTDGGKQQYSETRYLYNGNNLLGSKLTGEHMEFNHAGDVLVDGQNQLNFDRESYSYSTDYPYVGSWFPAQDAAFQAAMSMATTSHQILLIATRRSKLLGVENGDPWQPFAEPFFQQELPVSDAYLHYAVYGGKVLNDLVTTQLYGSNGVAQPTTSRAIRILNFDSHGRPTLFQKGNSDALQFASWLTSYDYPMAYGTVGASGDLPVYSSFEPNEGYLGGPSAGAIISDGTPVSMADAPSGDYVMHQSPDINGARLSLISSIPANDFTLSFWYKGGGTISGGGLQDEQLSSDTWKMFSIPCAGGQPVDFEFNGDYYVDELRVVPHDAQLQTAAYRGLVGTLCQVDANGQPTRYRYDKFNRLTSVLDGDGNVLKAYRYNYGLTGADGGVPANYTSEKHFTFTYTPGEYVTMLDDHYDPLETRVFDSGELKGVILVTNGSTGTSVEVPFDLPNLKVTDLNSIDVSIASSVSQALSSQTIFSNVFIGFEGRNLTIKVNNPNIPTDVSRFTVSVKQFLEIPDFNNYGYRGNNGIPSLTVTN